VFKNVPSLKKLTLESCAFGLDLLEKIHASCPLIKSLFIRNAHIIIAKEYVLPLTILPADSLLSLSIEEIFCFNINGLLLEYITSKYRHLKKLTLLVETKYAPLFFKKYYGYESEDDDFNQGDLIRGMIQKKKKRKKTTLILCIIEHTPIYKSLADELENTKAVYKESGTSFFSNLTKTIKSITTDSDVFNNINK
jgi:hypothetical protein